MPSQGHGLYRETLQATRGEIFENTVLVGVTVGHGSDEAGRIRGERALKSRHQGSSETVRVDHIPGVEQQSPSNR